MNENLIVSVRFAVIVACVLTAGCAGRDLAPRVSQPVEPPALIPSPTPATIAPSVVAAAAPAPQRAESKPETKAAAPAPAAAAAAKKAAPVKDVTVEAEPEPKKPIPAKETAPAKAVAKTAVTKPVVAEAAKVEAPAPAPAPVARKQEPTLDVAGLTARLGETKAIGVFTKLALKNQMDDLLDRFRAAYQGGQKANVASLRPPFDALVLKVVSQLRPGDPSLARTIEGSREAIWGILSDPEKFKSVT